ncbi:MAG: HesA/MoeB/ThiF family protein [Deltaproteobacteria bacterium]|nr:HesA/MoeB/ThiF family protein [Deltaproteobacteria bacterium]
MQNRYEKQIKLSEIGEAGQKKLNAASVAVVGVGGLGNVIASYLAPAGVGRIKLIDGDSVELSNLHRQILFSEKDIKENKAHAMHKKIKELNSTISVESFPIHLQKNNIDKILSNVDIVVDGTDNFKTRFLINNFCKQNNKTWVYGSIDQWHGECAVFRSRGPCLNCIFPNIEEGLFQNCNESGVLGPSVGMVAMFQAQLVLQEILFPEGNQSFLYLIDTKNFEVSKIKIKKNKNCLNGRTSLPEISYNTYLNWKKKDKNIILLDIREREQYEKDALEGAEHLSYRSLLQSPDALKNYDKDKTYVLYCEKHLKTPFAKGVLEENGFKNVFILDQGYDTLRHCEECSNVAIKAPLSLRGVEDDVAIL